MLVKKVQKRYKDHGRININKDIALMLGWNLDHQNLAIEWSVEKPGMMVISACPGEGYTLSRHSAGYTFTVPAQAKAYFPVGCRVKLTTDGVNLYVRRLTE